MATIVHNHLTAAASTGDASYGTGPIEGGDKITLFAGAAAGDFTPAGALLTNRKTPVVKFDQRRILRGVQGARWGGGVSTAESLAVIASKIDLSTALFL